MEKESLHGQINEDLKDIIKMEKKTEKEYSIGQMGINVKVNGMKGFKKRLTL